MHQSVKLQRLFYKYQDDMEENKSPKSPVKKKIIVKTDEVEEDCYPPYNFSWFVQNKIAAMGWPQTVGNLNYLVQQGIDHLITLSPEKRPPILDCEKPLKWTEIRVEEFCAPSLKQILKFIEICQRAEIRGETVGVHCRQGHGRTGTMLACYLVNFQDMAPERAVLTVRTRRPGSIETYEQEKAVCHYHDCLRGTITHVNYKLVDDKGYFDEQFRDSSQDKSPDISEDEAQAEEVKEDKPKSKAMVINHKIYF